MKKKPKKSTRKKLVKQLDALWSLLVRKRDGRCVVCGRTDGLAAHHCIVRKGQSMGVRWLLKNGVSMCYSCHICKLHSGQADKEWLEKFIAILDKLITKEEQEEIRLVGHSTTKFSITGLEELVKAFKEKL